ncbi:hypothetical protein ANN_07308 [Periplaneta americana]|uniref:Uncharacterized protein n=1 Tax=Periplaneta americana TaxID=6978 RepID=A0ABQ8SZH9_PERAM|nr:hypothetical protein ANN_07308 [Periplaneta americana]
MADLCEGGNEPSGSLKAIRVPPIRKYHCSNMKLQVSIILGYAIERQLFSQEFCDNFSRRWRRHHNIETSRRLEIQYCRRSTESYPAFARIGLRENPGKNLNQVTCPDRDSNPGHLVSQPDALTVTP